MPVATANGKKFNFPEGTTPEQMGQAIDEYFANQTAQPDPYQSVVDDMSNTDRALAGAGKAVVDTGRGVDQLANKIDLAVQDQANNGSAYNPLTWAAKAGQAYNDWAGVDAQGTQQQLQADEQYARERDAALMATGAGRAGNIAGNVAVAAPTAFIPGANSYTGAALIGAATGAVQPTVEGESTLNKMAIGAAGGAAGQAIGQGIGLVAKNYAAKKAAEQAAQKAGNAVKDATVLTAKEVGYVIPPVQVNPSKTNRLLEGLAGKITTGQSASIKNQSVTNNLVKKALGLAEDAPLTPETLSGIRAEAGKAYGVLRDAGPIQTDDIFRSDLGKIVNKYQGAAKDFPELAKNEIADTVAMIDKEGFDAGSAVDAISILRDKADKAFRGGDKSFGKAYKSMADSLEGVIERNIEQTGDAGKALLKDFRDSRQLIAKTYSVESALNPATGNINAKKLSAQLNKGKPLSGELKQVGRFAQAFPKAAEEVTSSMPGISPLDYGAALITAGTTGNPSLMSTVLGRPLVRSALLSSPYQKLMVNSPSYAPNLLQRAAPLLQSDVTNALLRSAPASAYLSQQ